MCKIHLAIKPTCQLFSAPVLPPPPSSLLSLATPMCGSGNVPHSNGQLTCNRLWQWQWQQPFCGRAILGRNVLQHCKWCTEIAVNIKIHTYSKAFNVCRSFASVCVCEAVRVCVQIFINPSTHAEVFGRFVTVPHPSECVCGRERDRVS